MPKNDNPLPRTPKLPKNLPKPCLDRPAGPNKPGGRLCIICDKLFASSWAGHRRCSKCDSKLPVLPPRMNAARLRVNPGDLRSVGITTNTNADGDE